MDFYSLLFPPQGSFSAQHPWLSRQPGSLPRYTIHTSTKMKERTEKHVQHRVDRVLGSSPVVRTKWNPPPPHPYPKASVSIPFGSRGDTLACGRGGRCGSEIGRGDRHCGTLGIQYMYGTSWCTYSIRDKPSWKFVGHTEKRITCLHSCRKWSLLQDMRTKLKRTEMEFLCGIFNRGFWAFTRVFSDSSFCLVFYLHFFSSKCYSWIDSSFLVLRIRILKTRKEYGFL